MAQNGCYLIQKPTVRDATMNDRFVADFRRLRGQGPKSTHNGHSSSLSRTSAIGSQSGRSNAAIN
jgi:hypothetical protein